MWAKQAADALRVRQRVIGQAWTRCPEELDLRHVDRCRYIGGSFKRVPQLTMFARDNLSSSERLVRKEGFEPPRPFGHKILSLARLPVPPLPQWWLYSTSLKRAAPQRFWAGGFNALTCRANWHVMALDS